MNAAVFAAAVAAGAVGAVTRAWVTWLVARWVGHPGTGTLVVNLTGAVLAGWVAGAAERWPSGVAAALLVGFLGAFTTFSTWMVELHGRWRRGARASVVVEAAATLAAGVALASVASTLAGR